MDTEAERMSQFGPVGLGTFPFSGVFSPIDQGAALQVLERFLEAGGKYVETAPSYPVNTVDLGALLRDVGAEVSVATKCVTSIGPDGGRLRSGKSEVVRAQCEAELKRLGVERLSLLQAHITPEDVDPAETCEAMNQLRGEGLVEFTGVSNVTLAQLNAFERGGPIDFVQNRMSLLHRPDPSLVEYCTSSGIRLNPYQVIERGQLLGRSSEYAEGDLRLTKAEYVGTANGTITRWVAETLAPLGTEEGLSLEQLSIGWVLAQPGVDVAVVGATAPDQAARNASVVALPERLVRLVDEAYEELVGSLGTDIQSFRGLAST
jgi:aryl-alcohol dehydrogenase-like predicted oxidoreductase